MCHTPYATVMLLDTVAVADISAGEGAGWEGGERLDDLEFITCATEDTAMVRYQGV